MLGAKNWDLAQLTPNHLVGVGIADFLQKRRFWGVSQIRFASGGYGRLLS
jgi:hypothetical protein